MDDSNANEDEGYELGDAEDVEDDDIDKDDEADVDDAPEDSYETTERGEAPDEHAAEVDEEMQENEDAEDHVESEVMEGTETSEKRKKESSESKDVGETREQHYSTRGRNASRETDTDVVGDRLDRSSHHGLDDEDRDRTLGASASSFLDALGEDERRTRTRFLPDVDGIHMLHKSEIRQDLQLARTVMSSSGVSSTLVSRKARSSKRVGRDDDDEMMEDDEGMDPSEDERMSAESIGITGYSAIDNTVRLPSRAFVAPPEMVNGDDGSGKLGLPVSSPHVVEAVTAFNPPRPPESVGAKKKHRMLRWERRPQDVEVDLSNYRKTVHRTRQELVNALEERERLEAMSAHLRIHFLSQLRALNKEGYLLNEEFGNIQLRCVKAADLLQSRTRSRGVGKGSYVMKDVLNILKQKAAEVASLSSIDTSVFDGQVTSGLGGISSLSFVDWERGHVVEPSLPASGWLLRGSMVSTPFGKGTVLHVFGPAILDRDAKVVEGAHVTLAMRPGLSQQLEKAGINGTDDNAEKAGIDSMQPSATNGGPATKENDADRKAISPPKANEKKNSKKKSKNATANGGLPRTIDPGQLLPPRACVRFQFGIGYFPIDLVTVREDVAAYSDTMLASRWKEMVASALSVAGCLDHSALASAPDEQEEVTDSNDMDVDEAEERNDGDPVKAAREFSERFLPSDAGMMPTAAGRGAILYEVPIAALEAEINRAILDNGGILGKRDNKGVPDKFRVWEDIRDELSIVKAQVLQRRNELARQRRIRNMNERTFASSRDKSYRSENLVLEMRADLKSLKDRLDFELMELGIDGEKTERLLSAHYREEERPDFSNVEATPPKRKRSAVKDEETSRFSPKLTRRHAADSGADSLDDADLDDGKNGVSTDDDVDVIIPPSSKRARPGQ